MRKKYAGMLNAGEMALQNFCIKVSNRTFIYYIYEQSLRMAFFRSFFKVL
jgi:hypothetical protein